MPKVDSIPRNLKPYISHGVSLSGDGDQRAADCPFCGKEQKFYVSVKTGLYQCKVCGTGNAKGGGNPLVFLRELWKLSDKQGTDDYASLSGDRKLLYPETPLLWEIVKSATTGDWLVPGYGVDGKLHQLYHYVSIQEKGQWVKRLLPTPGVHEEGKSHGLHGVNLFDKSKSTVYLCEGLWDGIALWEILRACKRDDEGKLVFAGEASSLLKDANVLAAPGCNVWQDQWCQLLGGKHVILCYDSDHPNEKTGKSAGYEGMQRVCDSLATASPPPASVKMIHWGPAGYSPDLKSGWDLRDSLSSSGETVQERTACLESLLTLVDVIPAEWVKGRSALAAQEGKVELNSLPCESWKTLRNTWIKALKWTEGLDYALSCILATAASTDLPGDQLWIKVVSPPSTGKTTLVEGAAVSRDYTFSKDTLTGLYSGFQTDAEGKEDLSMIPKLKGKTFIVKDGDTILQNPAMTTILSQFRALYDRNFGTQFKNKMSRDYKDVNCTVVLCGTEKIRKIDESELGERFLDVVIMEGIDLDHEEDICDRVINRLCDNEEEGEDHSVQLSLAKRLTGGYLEHLRRTAVREWGQVEVPQNARRVLKNLAIFVAHMRARPGAVSNAKHAESDNREMAPRLTGQLVRLAKCLAIVLQRKSVDPTVLDRVRRCALDTSRGVTLRICETLFEAGVEGGDTSVLAARAKITVPRTRELLQFLQRIAVTEVFEWRDPTVNGGITGGLKKRWRLTERMKELYHEAIVRRK